MRSNIVFTFDNLMTSNSFYWMDLQLKSTFIFHLCSVYCAHPCTLYSSHPIFPYNFVRVLSHQTSFSAFRLFSHLFQIIPLQFQCPNTDHAASSNLAAGRLSIASSSIMIHYTFFSFIAMLDMIGTRFAAQQ